MTWSDASDTRLESTVGDGSLWLFDAATPKGAEVVRVPESTGRVANVIPLPGTDRPMLATEADGLWVGVATNGGYAQGLSGSPIYHIAVGSDLAKLVFVGGHATFWMVASGHSLWDDIGTFSDPGARLTQTIWRFDGPNARRVFHAKTELPFGISVIGNSAEGLWTVVSQLRPGSRPNADTDTDCTGTPAVVRIDPATGRQQVVATPPEGTMSYSYICEGEDLAGDQAVISGGNMYLLDDTAGPGETGYTMLFRVRL
jgi:hypothetical protein